MARWLIAVTLGCTTACMEATPLPAPGDGDAAGAPPDAAIRSFDGATSDGFAGAFDRGVTRRPDSSPPTRDARAPSDTGGSGDAVGPQPVDAAALVDIGRPLDARLAMDAAVVRDAAVEPDAAPEPARCGPPSGQCPTPPAAGVEEGQGLVALPACDYRLEDADEWGAQDAVIDALADRLPVVGVEGLLRDLNRNTADLGLVIRARVDHLEWGFRWNDGDNAVAYWYPQGITGSGDANRGGEVDRRRVLAASWYFKVDRAPGDIDKGVRISFADVTDPDHVSYRHALLVAPYSDGADPNFGPVRNHAGGIVWYRNWLYVADTRVGFRVFDLSRIMQVRTGNDRIGLHRPSGTYEAFDYRYIIPQMNTYRLRQDSCATKFSFVSLDRSTAPHSLLSGEYHVDAIEGRLLRWALDEETGRLQGTDDIPAVQAYAAGHDRMQGALSWEGQYWLQCSSQLGVFGQLYRTERGEESETLTGPDGPEDLYYDPTTGRLWSHTEDLGNRNVYYSDLDDLD